MMGSPPQHDHYLATFPHGFKIGYVINGHMEHGEKVWPNNIMPILSRVRLFWRTGADTITGTKNKIIKALHDPRYPDDIFDADTRVTFRDENGQLIALMSRMKYPERRGEVSHARRALRAAGASTIESDCTREGSGDTLFDPNYGIWWVGVGERTAVGAGRQLTALSGRPTIEITTPNDDFFHLDTFLSFLPKGHVVVYKDAMNAASYKTLCKFYPDPSKRLELTKAEAMSFAANMQIVTRYKKNSKNKHHVLLPHDCPPRVGTTLKEWGYHPKPIDISGIRLAGGGTHCCFQRVWDLRRYPTRALPPLGKILGGPKLWTPAPC